MSDDKCASTGWIRKTNWKDEPLEVPGEAQKAARKLRVDALKQLIQRSK